MLCYQDTTTTGGIIAAGMLSSRETISRHITTLLTIVSSHQSKIWFFANISAPPSFSSNEGAPTPVPTACTTLIDSHARHPRVLTGHRTRERQVPHCMVTARQPSLRFLGPTFRLSPTQSPSISPVYSPLLLPLHLQTVPVPLCFSRGTLAPMEYPWTCACVRIPLCLATISSPGTSVLVVPTSFSRRPRSDSSINLERRRASVTPFMVHPHNPLSSVRTSNMTYHALSISIAVSYLELLSFPALFFLRALSPHSKLFLLCSTCCMSLVYGFASPHLV